MYYKVNTKLTVEVACKAKESGVGQFIFMSTMSVYSGGKDTYITEATLPCAKELYGITKLEAEKQLKELESNCFKVVILRPPLIYGKGCKGNFFKLKILARHVRVFPKVENRRSMLHIDSLCRFVQLMIDNGENGTFFPQDKEYVNTSKLVERLAMESGHRVIMLRGFGGLIKIICHFPGKIGSTMKKVFGDYVYAHEISEYKEEYRDVFRN